MLRDDAPEAHVFLAMMYMRDGDCGKAEPEIRSALDANPKLPLVNFLNGQCLMDEMRNDWPGAIDAFQAELAVDPNHFDANLYLGDLLREGASPRRGAAVPRARAAAAARHLGARFSLGAVYVALGRTEEALPLLESVAQVAPDHLQTHMQLAVATRGSAAPPTPSARRRRSSASRTRAKSRFFRGVSDALARLLALTDPKP